MGPNPNEATQHREDMLVDLICAFARGPRPEKILRLIVAKTREIGGLKKSDPAVTSIGKHLPTDVDRVKRVIERCEAAVRANGMELPIHLDIPKASDGIYRAVFKHTDTRLDASGERAWRAESELTELKRKFETSGPFAANSGMGKPDTEVTALSGRLEYKQGGAPPGAVALTDQSDQTAPPREVEPAGSIDQSPQTGNVRQDWPVMKRWGRIGWIVAVGAISFIAGIVLMLARPGFVPGRRGPDSLNRPVTISIPPPPGGEFVFGNNVGGIALSPDGNWLTYVAWTDRSRLWVRPVDDSDGRIPARKLDGTEGAAYPFWSPDSKWIGFFADGALKKVSLIGAEPEIVCDVAIGRGGTWTDGEIIFGSLLSGLKKVPDQGGTPADLTVLDRAKGETGHSWPQLLPGGRILYWVRSNKAEYQGSYVASLSNPKNSKLVKKTAANAVYAEDIRGGGNLLWLVNGELHKDEFDLSNLKLAGHDQEIEPEVSTIWLFGRANLANAAKGLLFFADFNTLSQFRWFSGPGWKDDKNTLGTPGPYTAFRLSPNGRIAVSMDRPGGTNLLIDISSRSAPLVADPGMNSYPVWSPDGRAVVYTNSNLNLYLREVDGKGGSRQLTRSPSAQYPTDWSGDGKSLLFWEVSQDKPKRQLWALQMTAAGKSSQSPELYTLPSFGNSSGSNEAWGRFCPGTNPRWVVYQSDASPSHRNEIYAQHFPRPEGTPVQISQEGGEYPVCSPDGRQVFYLAPDNFLMRAQVASGSDSIQVSQWQKMFKLPGPDIGWPPYDLDPVTGRILVRVAPESDETLSSASTGNPGKPPLKLVINWTSLPWH